jgi:hypothetical protein
MVPQHDNVARPPSAKIRFYFDYESPLTRTLLGPSSPNSLRGMNVRSIRFRYSTPLSSTLTGNLGLAKSAPEAAG